MHKTKRKTEMKKLLIAMGAVALGFAANAAALNWSTWAYAGTDPDADGAWITGGQAYLVMVSDTSTFAVADDLTVTGGTIVDSAAFDGGTAAGAWNDTAALVDGTKYYFAVIDTTAGSGIDVPTTGYFTVDKNGGNATGSGFYEVMWSASTGFDLSADGGFAGASMATTVAPEPTSGLLLLLGMAGLALKRKRA